MDAKLDKLKKKIDLLEDKCVLMKNKDLHINQLSDLKQKVEIVKNTLRKCREEVRNNLGKIKEDYETAMEESRKTQLELLVLIDKMSDVEIVEQPVTVPESAQTKAMPKQKTAVIPKPRVKETPQIRETPLRTTISDYGKSPLVSRKKPIKLEFLDFEAEITPEMFSKIPA